MTLVKESLKLQISILFIDLIVNVISSVQQNHQQRHHQLLQQSQSVMGQQQHRMQIIQIKQQKK